MSLLASADQSFIALALETGKESAHSSILIIHPSPLRFDLYLDGVLQISANEQSLMHFEHSSANAAALADSAASASVVVEEVDRHNGKKVVDYGEDGECGALLLTPLIVLCYRCVFS